MSLHNYNAKPKIIHVSQSHSHSFILHKLIPVSSKTENFFNNSKISILHTFIPVLVYDFLFFRFQASSEAVRMEWIERLTNAILTGLNLAPEQKEGKKGVRAAVSHEYH